MGSWPFRMETRAWVALTWGELNIAIPIKTRFTFWFYKGLCKQNVSHHGGVSHFTALENSNRAVGLKITQTNKNNSGGAGNGLWSCRFSAFRDRPSWEICKSFVNYSKHARNGLGTTTSSSSKRFGSVKWIRFWSFLVIAFFAVTNFFPG